MTDDAPQKASLGRRIGAAICDFFLVFLAGGFLIANFTGERTEGGFDLQGGSALVLFAVIGLYFFLGNRFGGTVFQRLFRTRG